MVLGPGRNASMSIARAKEISGVRSFGHDQDPSGTPAGPPVSALPPTGLLIGYARCPTERQDLAAQRQILRGLGVSDERLYLDHGLTGTNRSSPGLEQALAAVREGDTLVVPKLDRLARSVPDARAIGDSLAARGVRLSLGGTVYDPTDPMGKCFFNILATFAEFEVDLLRMRTREGMAIARANGKLRGKAPKLGARQHAHLIKLHDAGEHSIAEIAELFSVSRATVYREIIRAQTRRATAAPSPR
jgi:DNA invertase Pin-like site-specific DNA recombinase